MKRAARKGRKKYTGICSDAKALGVHRNTLRRALNGEWNLPGLAQRYKALKERQNAEKQQVAKAA